MSKAKDSDGMMEDDPNEAPPREDEAGSPKKEREAECDATGNVEYMQRRQARIKLLQKNFEKTAGFDGLIDLDEFRSALRSKNDFFTDRLFGMFDQRADGRISLEEFISFLLGIKTVEDKISLLFDLYDLTGDGKLDRDEVETVIEAMVHESRLKLDREEVKVLSNGFFEQAIKETVEVSGEKPSDATKISREGFSSLLKKSEALSSDVSTLIDHWIGAVEEAVAVSSKQASSQQEEEDKAVDLATQASANPTFYAFFFAYFLIVLVMMVTAAVLHREAKDRDGNANLFLIAARIFGFPLNFVCTMIYVFMLRRLHNALRGLGAITVFPMDHNLFFHMISGWIIFVFGYIHTLVHFVNFKLNVSPDPDNYLSQNKLTKDSSGYHPPEEGANYTYAEWMLTPKPHLFGLLPGWANITGIVLMTFSTLILLTSQDCVRRGGYFNLFYYCHLSYIPFAVLLIIHAPNFSYFFPVVGVFVAIDLLDRMCYGRKKSYVATGILLPSDTVCLVIKKSERMAYKTGDWLSLNIPSIANYEWHAFTISSSPEMPNVLTLHIKVVGFWTRRLQKMLEGDHERLVEELAGSAPLGREETRALPHQYSQLAKHIPYNPPTKRLEHVVTDKAEEADSRISRSITCYIGGPYRAPATSIFTAEHAVLIATGVGVTPMASILHTILYRHLAVTHNCPSCDNRWADKEYWGLQRLKKVDFIWIVKDPTEVSWFIDLLAGIDLEQETTGSQLPRMVESHIYVTRALAKTDMCAVALRVALNLFFRRTKRDIVYGLKSKIIAGRPNLTEIFENLDKNKKGKVSVFYCGNSVVGDILEEKCTQFKFSMHREVF